MLARVTSGEALPERLDKMSHEIREHVLPALKKQDGFAGALLLVERGSGKVLAMTLWESEQGMNATSPAVHWLHVFSAEAGSGMVRGEETYEVAFSEGSSQPS